LSHLPWLVSALAVMASPVRAQECGAAYSLFSPTPDACLEDIVTDRPHKTDTPAIMPPGHFQAELGLVEYGIAPGHHDDLTLANSELKLGIVPRLDLELFYAPVSQPVPGTITLGRDYAVRAKVLLLRGADDRWLVTLVPYVEGGHGRLAGAGGSLFFGYDFESGLELELNTGYVASLEGEPGSLVVTSAATLPLAAELSGFIELFTDSAPGGSAHTGTLDTGLLYVLTRDLQLDGGVYFGLYGDAPLATPFLGLSVRI
jgi:hypothetical protein